MRIGARLGVLAAVLAAAASVAVAPAVGGPAGTIRGSVRNAGTGAPVAGASLQLVSIAGQGAEPVAMTRADAQGRFAFTGLQDGRYLVTARYQGVSYAAHAVVSGGGAEVTVQVYEVAATLPLRISLLGMAVDVQRGYVRISEVLHLQNPTTRTFLGELTMPLPAGARFVIYNEGFHQPRATGASITDRLIIRPGAHQLAYTYSVRGDGEVALSRRLILPVDRVEMFVSAPAEARSPRLQALPSVTTEEGRTLTRASGRAVPAGDLAMAVAGVPSARLWLAPAAAGTLAAVLVVGLMWAIAKAAS